MLVSHSPADEPWAHWITVCLRAAGHEVHLDPADGTFAARLAEGRFSSTGPVLVLLSGEHRATPADWALLASASTLVGRLVALRLDAGEPPQALRAVPCRSLHGLGEEDALEVVLAVAGGIRREKVRTTGLPTASRW